LSAPRTGFDQTKQENTVNTKQLTRCTQRTDRNYQIVADIMHPQGCKVAIKMGGRKVSHRRIKAAMQAAKTAWPEVDVFFRHGGTLVTAEIASGWQQHRSIDQTQRHSLNMDFA